MCGQKICVEVRSVELFADGVGKVAGDGDTTQDSTENIAGTSRDSSADGGRGDALDYVFALS